MELTKEQMKIIKDYYKKIIPSKEFKDELENKRKDVSFITELLDKDKLKDMTEIEFGKLISNLWSSLFWGNKDFLVNKIIQSNGMDKIRKQLINLLYGSDNFEKRFDNFLKEIKGIGPAALTEILCKYNPRKFGIWNDKARKGLKELKFKDLPLNKYYITGREYIRVNDALLEILNVLKKLGFSNPDLLVVDNFLYFVSTKKFKEEGDEDFDHDEIRDFIKDIGNWLGFETETEKLIAEGARVDDVWRARIANLGVVTYVFEVHKHGSIDSLILNLEKALSNPTVQKIVAVSNAKQLERIKKEVRVLSENFRKALAYWEVKDVVETHDSLSKAIENIAKLELVKSQFGE